ncbi:hypothetical protein [Neochlamydia sp. S13]|uniref:hypothetical protein n=1 Tax=Neochlamydia sp. S13 TaxID=1353976 RepID=UPI001E4D797D|nr:hypothetical protein [Neochlamydia sp. S13]
MAGGQLLVSPARGGGQKFMSPGGQFVMSLDINYKIGSLTRLVLYMLSEMYGT